MTSKDHVLPATHCKNLGADGCEGFQNLAIVQHKYGRHRVEINCKACARWSVTNHGPVEVLQLSDLLMPQNSYIAKCIETMYRDNPMLTLWNGSKPSQMAMEMKRDQAPPGLTRGRQESGESGSSQHSWTFCTSSASASTAHEKHCNCPCWDQLQILKASHQELRLELIKNGVIKAKDGPEETY